MTLIDLSELVRSGRFHHASYRDHGTVWEGLHVYAGDANGFRGYSYVGAFFKDNPELHAAEEAVKHTGISIGAYGNG